MSSVPSAISLSPSSRAHTVAAFVLGLLAIAWVGVGFIGSSALALGMTLAIAAAYLAGAQEIRRYTAASSGLAAALAQVPPSMDSLDDWLDRVPAPLQHAVRQRVQNGSGALPGLALTPYLIGLLVMLGMLGTFLGMVITFKGAVFALEGSADLGAIRGALAAPIKGLGLSFGTSVAGVAGSAMLGLMSAFARRQRSETVRQLDRQAATTLRPFTAAHQAEQGRDHTYAALQRQADALPRVVTQMQALMEQVERRHQQLDEQLTERQDRFHREAAAAYTGLGQTVARALNESLATSARVAGESLQPLVASAMTAVAQESSRLHERVGAAVQTQLSGLSTQFADTAATVAKGWHAALQQHERSSTQLAHGLGDTLAQFSAQFEQRATQLLAHVQQSTAQQQAEQAQAETLKQAAWTAALQAMASSLQTEWQQASAHTLAHQQALSQALAETASALQRKAHEQAAQHAQEVNRLLAQSEALLQARTQAEAQWVQQHGQHMEQLAALWRNELAALRREETTHLQTLRSDEAERGQAAVQRLGELQGAVSQHLATLGNALEAPLSRLLETASEAPRAAAEVMEQLRLATGRFTERDNLALQERTELLAHISSLLQNVQQTTGEQRAAIEALVTSATAVLDQTGAQFAQTLGAQAGRADEQTAQLATSAAALATLGEAFQQGVAQFSSSNEQLVDGLQRVEQAMGQSMARSDEQLAYYVAQAREVIDLSISAQQGIVEDMRQLRASKPAAVRTAVPAPGAA